MVSRMVADQTCALHTSAMKTRERDSYRDTSLPQVQQHPRTLARVMICCCLGVSRCPGRRATMAKRPQMDVWLTTEGPRAQLAVPVTRACE